MKPVLEINPNLGVIDKDGNLGLPLSSTGLAYRMTFNNGKSESIVWMPVSQSKIINGVLHVAEWLLREGQTGIATMISLGYPSNQGSFITTETHGEKAVETNGLTKEAIIQKGFFTVEFPHLATKHYTFRIKTSPKTGKTIIGLLTGSNNLSDYTYFAFIEGTTLRHWREPKYRYIATKLPVPNQVMDICFKAIINNAEAAGQMFSRESSLCMRCGKVLTTPDSLDRGIGPECAGLKFGKVKK